LQSALLLFFVLELPLLWSSEEKLLLRQSRTRGERTK
jgi:hypothetical protein